MSTENAVSVGIIAAGMYLPDPVLTAADIAAESGLSERVVRDKLGIYQKHRGEARPVDRRRSDDDRGCGHRLRLGRSMRQVGALRDLKHHP